jgi:hypothetical protein
LQCSDENYSAASTQQREFESCLSGAYAWWVDENWRKHLSTIGRLEVQLGDYAIVERSFGTFSGWESPD